MVKKIVKLVPQERFDLIDARALQQGTLDYLGNALGNLMGYSNGLLSELATDVSPEDRTLNFPKSFAFFVTKAASESTDGTGFSGEVVIYDPTSPAQVTQSIDYTATYNAKEAYFADGSLDAEGDDADENSRLLTIGAHAPFLWARPIKVEGQLDARRKWSVAQQTEVPVTMNTRTITAVEFAFSPSMPEVAEGSSNWAPIAKILQWTLATPKLIPISAFDSRKWHDRANTKTIGDVDNSIAGEQRDYFSHESPSITTHNIFETSDLDMNSPAVSLVYNMLLFDTNYENVPARQANATITDRLKQLAEYLGGGGTLKAANVKIKRNALGAAWNRFHGNASNGIVDQLNAVRVAIQNSVGSGILDHGSAFHEINSRWKPYERGGASGLSNLFTALKNEFRSHWSARPLRSLNSLALENIVLGDEAARHDEQITDLIKKVENLEERLGVQEAMGDPFAEVPINDAQALVPLLVASVTPNYYSGGSGKFEFLKVRHGPSDTGVKFEFFVESNAYSQVGYTRGGIRVTLPEETFLDGTLDLNDCVILATPTHKESMNPWILPDHKVISGRVEAGGGQNFAGNPYYNQVQGFVHEPSAVLNAFANFYQCTLNVLVRTRDFDAEQQSIEIYPVNSVPDIVNKGHDLRGYPNFGKWIDQIGGLAPEGGDNDHYEANIRGTWRDGHVLDTSQLGTVRTHSSNDIGGSDLQTDQVGGTIFGYLHGDQTDPRLFRSEISGSEFAKDEIFGHRDDLRGYCHDLTFLRPDRLFFEKNGQEYKFGGVLAGTEHIENYPLQYTNDDSNEFRVGNSSGRPPPPNDETRDARIGSNHITTNGRFIPSFSLVIYKPTFANLGNPEPVKRLTDADVSIVHNASNVPNENNVLDRTGDTSTRGGE